MKIHKSDSLICIEMEDISYSSVSIIEQKKLKLFTENTQYIYYKNTRIYIWIAILLEFITTRTSKHTTKTTAIILSTQQNKRIMYVVNNTLSSLIHLLRHKKRKNILYLYVTIVIVVHFYFVFVLYVYVCLEIISLDN